MRKVLRMIEINVYPLPAGTGPTSPKDREIVGLIGMDRWGKYVHMSKHLCHHTPRKQRIGKSNFGDWKNEPQKEKAQILSEKYTDSGGLA